MTLTDKDWTCWLKADSQVLKHKHEFENDSKNGSTLHHLYIAYKEYSTGGSCWCIYHGSTRATISRWHYAEEMPNEISKKLPNQNSINILMQDIDRYNFHVNFLMMALDLDSFAIVNKKNMSGSPQGDQRRTTSEHVHEQHILYTRDHYNAKICSTFSRLSAVCTPHVAAALMPKHSLYCNPTVALIYHGVYSDSPSLPPSFSSCAHLQLLLRLQALYNYHSEGSSTGESQD